MKKDRTILTPMTDTADFTATDQKLVFWKQVLPEAEILYTADGKSRKINFDKQYLEDCINSFKNKAIDQTCFQLANSNNGHGHDFDPERQRAEVLDMRLANEGEAPGLYAKMKFFNKKAARSVQENPNLGVSARVRENFTRVDGTFVKRAIIHVAGTIDPRVTGLSPWQAADMTYDSDNGNVLDLSEAHYEGNAPMAKKNKKVIESDEVGIPTDAEIDAMTDDELAAFLSASDEDENDEVEDDDEDDLDADELEDEADEPVLETAGASLSNSARRAISLANEQAALANKRANAALAKQAQAEFRGYRTELIAAGVRPADIDMCEPLLTRADDMVIDLSSSDEDDLNVSAIIRKLLESHKGDIDMSVEQGHSGSVDFTNDENDPDAGLLALWETQFGNK